MGNMFVLCDEIKCYIAKNKNIRFIDFFKEKHEDFIKTKQKLFLIAVIVSQVISSIILHIHCNITSLHTAYNKEGIL